jgi:hypothetical protein
MYNSSGNPHASTFRRPYNDDVDQEDQLANKATQLKQITISMRNEIKESNKLVNGIDDDMDKTHGFMGNTIGRVLRLSRSGGNCKIYFYLTLFSLFVFFVLYLVIKWYS